MASTSNDTYLEENRSSDPITAGNEDKPSTSQEELDSDDNKANDNPAFECNICFDSAKNAVVSQCGHLFCWPCLHRWLETRPTQQRCPVCKSAISKEQVTPIYGRGGNTSDPRDSVPPRPPGQHTEAPTNFPGFSFGDGGFQMSFGIGAFPLGLLWSTLNDGRPGPPPPGTQQAREERFLNYVFCTVTVLLILWLMLA